MFYDEGEYPVAVQATDLFGRTVTETTTVNVSNVPPVVSIGPDIFADENEAVDFRAVAYDPGHDILLYEWDFGDSSTGSDQGHGQQSGAGTASRFSDRKQRQ